MKITRREFVGTIPALALAASASPLTHMFSEPDDIWQLWYRQPARRWLESLPVGNGRLGAMVFGEIEGEVLKLNESTVWSGSPNITNVNPSAREYLGEMRQLLFDGKYAEGNSLCAKHLCGREDSYGTHLPLANLHITQSYAGPVANDYVRWLDLPTAVTGAEFSAGGVKFSREIFASNPDQVIVVQLAASESGQVALVISIDSGDLPGEVRLADNQTLTLVGNSWEKRHSDGRLGVNFIAQVKVLNEGGQISAEGTALQVRGANAVTLLVGAGTNYSTPDYENICRKQMASACAMKFGLLRERHIADHSRLFNRVTLDLGGSGSAHKPTDERLAAVAKGDDDPQLTALFFQYGRYLLIAGSREDSPLPMNLQGIWNDNLAANMVWTCDFHLDINTQQNYWPSEVCNLPECSEPLFNLVQSISETGRRTARELYGTNGWVCHVYTNAWGFTAAGVGMPWGPFVTGGVWAASHLWEHYLFTQERTFLEKEAYPVLRSAAEFFLDYLVEDPKHHWLVTGPSISPENTFLSPDGHHCFVSMGPTCDRELIYGLFSWCIQASTDLNTDAEFRSRLTAARSKLPPFQIGKHGQLQEWLEDFDEAIPNHRHTSHLIALFPLDQITPDKTPELAKAARVTIERRTGQKDWEDVEWSRANLIHFFARLRDGDSAHKHLLGLLREDTEQNMLTYSRGGVAGAAQNIFAIDGNTAGTSGVAEMLLQSYADIHLLPALPAAWRDGSIKGLRARGGFEVGMQWKNGNLEAATIHATQEGKCSVRYRDKLVALHLRSEESIRFGEGLLRLG